MNDQKRKPYPDNKECLRESPGIWNRYFYSERENILTLLNEKRYTEVHEKYSQFIRTDEARNLLLLLTYPLNGLSFADKYIIAAIRRLEQM